MVLIVAVAFCAGPAMSMLDGVSEQVA